MTTPRWRASSTRSKPSSSITGIMQHDKKPHVISLPMSKASTTAHQNTHLSMLLKKRDFADWDAIPWGILGSVALVGPAIAVARLEAVAVEEAGNQIVAGD